MTPPPNVNRLAASIASRCELPRASVEAALVLMEGGATLPFIARYRKDVTGGLSDEQLRRLEAARARALTLELRREAIRASLEKQGLLNASRRRELDDLDDRHQLEEFYLPFKPRRVSKAARAIERGLSRLADALLDGRQRAPVEALAAPFVDPEKGVASGAEALDGALDIIVEELARSAPLRDLVRRSMARGRMTVASRRGRSEAAAESVYRELVGLEVNLRGLKPHRILAIDRGEREGLLSARIEGATARELAAIEDRVLHEGRVPSNRLLAEACRRAHKERLGPAAERTLRAEQSAAAQDQAVATFRVNLRALLEAPPLSPRVVLGVDPGFRSGCKCAVIDPKGAVLATATVYPHSGAKARARALAELSRLCLSQRVALITIGNGTASRETAKLIEELLSEPGHEELQQVITSEAGASVYSASELASAELPGLDVTLRGAVSIARRVLDPLAELVKIAPRSLGVGQYQHDLDAKRLDQALDGIVEQVVNRVGVDLNRSSLTLLSKVAGLNPRLAEAIVARRAQRPFERRAELEGIAGLGPRTFAQAAGFLRIADSAEPLERSAVHPESYAIARRIAGRLGRQIGELEGADALLAELDPDDFVTPTAGPQAIADILDELARPGRDPRGEAPSFQYSSSVEQLADLEAGMELPGTVTNVTDFGAFVDIGVHRDGLIHVSAFGRRIGHPSELVAVGQPLWVRVTAVDSERNRVSLERCQPPR